jgi:hypothetical protein
VGDQEYEMLDFPATQAYNHPIFWSTNGTVADKINLLLFQMDTVQLDQLRNSRNSSFSTLSDSVADFFKGDFHASQLPHWDRSHFFLSDVVNPLMDPRTPLGLKWFPASYNDNANEMFLYTNMTQPSKAVFACIV